MRHETAFAELTLLADLNIDANGKPVRVSAEGNHICVEVPDLATGLDLFRLGSPRGFGVHRLRAMADSLDQRRLHLTMNVRGRQLARIGHRTSGLWLKLLGLKRCQIRPWSLLQSILRRDRSAL
jgi:hypothetical protein